MREVGKTTLDDSLRAIVAADRLALSETVHGKDLLHRRLTVFYGYFALLAALAASVGRMRHVTADLDPRTLGFLQDAEVPPELDALVLRCLSRKEAGGSTKRSVSSRLRSPAESPSTAGWRAVAQSGDGCAEPSIRAGGGFALCRVRGLGVRG